MRRDGWVPLVVGLLVTMLQSASVEGQCSEQEMAKLVAMNAAPSDYFGVSVALDADTLVVGAYGDDYNSETTDSGAAYVLAHAAGVWAQQAKLVASDAAGED